MLPTRELERPVLPDGAPSCECMFRRALLGAPATLLVLFLGYTAPVFLDAAGCFPNVAFGGPVEEF